MPLCERLRVRERTSGEGTETLVAGMTVTYKIMRETFVSRVTLERPNLKIQVEYLDGPRVPSQRPGRCAWVRLRLTRDGSRIGWLSSSACADGRNRR